MAGGEIGRIDRSSSTVSVARTTGTLGGRQVVQAPSQAARFAKITGSAPPEGNIFVRYFESVETKVRRTAKSLDTQAGNLFSALKREPGGGLDALRLLNTMKTLRLHTERLSELHGTAVDPTDTLQIAMAGRFASMNNRELLDSFSTFMSDDMTKLRAALEREVRTHPENKDAQQALEDLGVMEATVMMEISTRVARSRAGADEQIPSLQERLWAASTNPGKEVLKGLYQARELSAADQGKSLSDRSLETLVNAGGRSATQRDRLQQKSKQIFDRKGIREMPPRQVGDRMRSADLTLNLGAPALLSIIGLTGAAPQQATGLANMWQMGQRPTDNEGTKKRDITERGFFPTLERDALDPDSRPIYGALNIGRATMGAAAQGYGGIFFRMKSEVKQRCTFTGDDTFNVTMCSVKTANLQQFTDGLDAMIGKLSPSARNKFAENNGELRRKLIDFFTAQRNGAPFSVYKLPERILAVLFSDGAWAPEVTQDDYSMLASFAETTFRDTDATRERVVGFDDIESLLPTLDEARLDHLMAAVTQPRISDVNIGNYIEAQIHGSVRFSDDVAALCLSQEDLQDAARALVKSRHPEDESYRPSAAEIKDASQEIIAKLKDFSRQTGVALELYDTRGMVRTTDRAALAAERFSETHRDIFAAAKNYAKNTRTTEGSFQAVLAGVSHDLGFTESLSQEELAALPEAIAKEAQQDIGGDHSRLDPAVLAKAAKKVIEKAVKQHMSQAKEVSEQRLYAFFDGPASRVDSFAGILSGVQTRRNAAFELNGANLGVLRQNIAKAVEKLNTGNKPVTLEQIKEIAQRETDAFIAMKQRLLATLDELTFAQPEYKERWKAFVLASSTLKDPDMLKCLHAQSLGAQAMLRAFTGEGGFQPEAFLTALVKFTNVAGFAQMALHNQQGRELARDDRYLFLDRVISLAVTTMPLSQEQKQALLDHLTSADTAQMRCLIARTGADPLLANNMSDALWLLAGNLSRELGQDRYKIEGDMNQKLKEAEKAAATSSPPAPLAQALAKTVKAQPLSPFPAPGRTVNASFAQFRRDELPAILDSYRQNEQAFDRTLIHGRRHISRALIYTRVLANIYQEKGLSPNTHALYRAVAFHDSGRRANGSDVYEQQSGDRLAQHLRAQGIEQATYISAASSCITCGRNIRLLEEGIMNSADSFEIIRTRGRQGFDTGRLWFMSTPVISANGQLVPPDAEMRDALLNEIDAFIRLTEPTDPPEQAEFEQAMVRGETRESVLRDLQEKAKAAKQRQLETEWAIPSGEYFNRVETALVENRTQFPLLYRYYTQGE